MDVDSSCCHRWRALRLTQSFKTTKTLLKALGKIDAISLWKRKVCSTRRNGFTSNLNLLQKTWSSDKLSTLPRMLLSRSPLTYQSLDCVCNCVTYRKRTFSSLNSELWLLLWWKTTKHLTLRWLYLQRSLSHKQKSCATQKKLFKLIQQTRISK